jgi:hypothetical protein
LGGGGEREGGGGGGGRVIDSSLLLSVFMSHKIYIFAFHTVGRIIEIPGMKKQNSVARAVRLQYCKGVCIKPGPGTLYHELCVCVCSPCHDALYRGGFVSPGMVGWVRLGM